ncbi:MAG TPA: cereblon family protein [Candidatus Paceibacterota bacterium]|nr:cereblon family protein [Verrucomicrobiota bacterium]HSA08897.1 cereblon family protein [Candidatus Paceibacterota bacterium]
MNARPLSFEESSAGALNWKASAATDAGVLTVAVAEPDLAQSTAATSGDTEGDWLCAWCHSRVANEKDRFPYDGKDEFTFANPEGVRFAIITFSRTLGCREVGPPSLEHTWFAGHTWSFCQCDRCGQQLGWYYAGQHHFAGLIKSRIVRALHVSN